MTEQTQTARQLVEALTASNLTFSTAESCTGGLIAKYITDIPGCSSVFFGGCITYTNTVKMQLLDVNPQIIDTYTEVSEECAKAMANGVRRKLGTTIGVSTTGYAGPGGGTPKNPVGTVYIAVATPQETVCRRIQASADHSRQQIREYAALIALQMVMEYANGTH